MQLQVRDRLGRRLRCRLRYRSLRSEKLTLDWLSRITPALTEASKSVQLVKMESDTMGAKRASDDWPTQPLRTLRFNALLSRQRMFPAFQIVPILPIEVDHDSRSGCSSVFAPCHGFVETCSFSFRACSIMSRNCGISTDLSMPTKALSRSF